MKRIIFFLVALTMGFAIQAQTFIVNGIGYSITSDSTCGVYSCTTPNCNIPPTVSYGSVDYTVTAIFGTEYISCINSSSVHIIYGNGVYGYRNNGSGRMYQNNIVNSITIPHTIKKISFSALSDFSALTEVHWNAENASATNQTYGQGIFQNCTNLTTVTIGDSVIKIPTYFLLNNQGNNVTEIVIPDNVIEIGDYAFYGCAGLSNISFSNNLRIIGDAAFSLCTGLFSIVLPDSVRTIGNNAFSGCSNMYNLYIGPNVDTIGDRAFSNCTFLHNVTYNPRNVSYQPSYYLFNGSDSISNLIIGNEVERIPQNFMNAKPNLRNVVFPEGLTTIGNNAFYNCGLENMVIPSTVTNIGQYAFYNNSNFSRIISLPTLPPAIYQSTFDGISANTEIVVPCSSFTNYRIYPWWNGMSNVKGTCRYSTINDSICNGEVYEYGTHSASATGTYYDTIHIDQYVDSMITVHLVVNPSYDYTHTEQICDGQTFSSYGFSENENGIYVHSLQSMNGCDSIVRLNLTVNPIYDTTITASICQGNTYTQYGFNTTMEGSHTQNLYTIAGCDSVVHLQLAVNPTYSEQLSDTITNVQGYQFVDTTLTQSGVYQRTLHTLAGCDSLLTLTLTVIPSVDTLIVRDTVLYPDTLIVVDTLIVYIDTLVIHDTITPCPVYRTYIHATIEQGEAYMDYGFNVSTPGVYCDTLQTTEGCDSIVCLYLTQTVGIGEVTNTRMFSIFPNPANSTIHLSVPEESGCGLINIVDNTGKIVITQTISEGENIIDVSILPVGVYYVRIGEMTSKLIIR